MFTHTMRPHATSHDSPQSGNELQQAAGSGEILRSGRIAYLRRLQAADDVKSRVGILVHLEKKNRQQYITLHVTRPSLMRFFRN